VSETDPYPLRKMFRKHTITWTYERSHGTINIMLITRAYRGIRGPFSANLIFM